MKSKDMTTKQLKRLLQEAEAWLKDDDSLSEKGPYGSALFMRVSIENACIVIQKELKSRNALS